MRFWGLSFGERPHTPKNSKQIIYWLLEFCAVLNWKYAFSKVETARGAAAHLTGFFFY